MAESLVSICILTMNEPKEVLDCLREQTFQDFEVVIANEKGCANALNKALQKAKGDIFVRLDDDVEMPRHWLENLIEPFSDSSIAGVTGPTYVSESLRKNRDSIRLAEKPNWFLRWLFDKEFKPGGIYKCGSVSYDSNYSERFLDLEKFEPDHLEGTNWAMRTELIRKVGGFDPKFDGVSEWIDTDVEFKIKKLGYKLCYNPRAFLWHNLGLGEHHNERFEGLGRIKNWLRFHFRHSKFHPKMIIWFLMMGGYYVKNSYRKSV